MGSLRILTVWLGLLVLVPAAALAVLGWRSVGDVDPALAVRARWDLDEAEGFAGATLLHVAQGWERWLQQAADDAASELRGSAPYRDLPTALAAAEANLRDRRLRVPVSLRLVGHDGRGILPAELSPEGEGGPADGAERFLQDLRARAEAARLTSSLDAALSILDEALPRVLTRAGRARLDVERGRLLLAAPGGVAAADSLYRGAVGTHDPALLGEVGRPWILLAVVAAEAGVAQAKSDLAAAEGRGLLHRLALHPVERRRARRAIHGEEPAPDLVRASAPVAGGARLEVAVPASILWGDLGAEVRAEAGRGPVPGPVSIDLGPVAPEGPFPSHTLRFGVETRRVVLRPVLAGREAWIRLTHTTAAVWIQRWREQRNWTVAGIGALLATVALGIALVRRALGRERAARRLQDDFVANVSHELRTPLTSVCLHAEMLAEDDVSPERRRAHVGVVRSEGARLMALVEEMLDFAALERGARRLEPEPVDLGAAARRSLEPYAALAERDGVALLVRAPAEGPFAFADRVAVGRILANLVANAWKHGRPSRDGAPGRVVVVAAEGPGGPEVLVSDDGPGVPEGERSRLFERFRRGTDASARPGVGLGLALARDLARRLGGDVVHVPEEPGATFRLALPGLPEERP